jgi:hypothetical protein
MNLILKFSKKIQWCILLILCHLSIYGQSSWGKLRLIYDASLEDQDRSVYERATKDNYNSHSSLFQTIAFPVDNLTDAKVAVDYVNDEFIVRIGNKELYPDLPDWQLLPIVRFANSSYQATITLYGDPQNKVQLRYHPAFLDNLLGLRLLQANLALISPELLVENPKDENGKYILDTSEEGLMPPANLNTSHRTLFNEIKKNNISYDSYILTDRDLNVFFNIDGDDLVFSDIPYYYFLENIVIPVTESNFREDLEPYFAEIEKNAKILLKEKYTPALNPRTNLRGLLIVLDENKQSEIFNPYALQYINDNLDKLDAILNQSRNKESTSVDYQAKNELTSSFKKNWTQLKRYNPLVYSAVENISHWAAFFRYVRLSNPNNWTVFLKKVENIEINAPAVHTPTSFE